MRSYLWKHLYLSYFCHRSKRRRRWSRRWWSTDMVLGWNERDCTHNLHVTVILNNCEMCLGPLDGGCGEGGEVPPGRNSWNDADFGASEKNPFKADSKKKKRKKKTSPAELRYRWLYRLKSKIRGFRGKTENLSKCRRLGRLAYQSWSNQASGKLTRVYLCPH